MTTDHDKDRDDLNYRLEKLEEAAIELHDAKIAWSDEIDDYNGNRLDEAEQEFKTALHRFTNCEAVK